MSSDQREADFDKPGSLSVLEVWGFGFSGLLLWFCLAPGVHAAMGPQAMFMWIPVAIIGIFLNLQIRRMALTWPDLAGGTPIYATKLWDRFPKVGRYMAFGYFQGWISVPPICAITLTDVLAAHLQPYGVELPIILTRVGLTVIVYVIAFSSLKALSVLHLFFTLPAVGLLLAFCAQGMGWLLISPSAPAILPAEWGDFNLSHWSLWFFLAAYAAYGCETGAAFSSESNDPKKASNVLGKATVLIIPVFVLGSWILMQNVPGQKHGDNVFKNLSAAAVPFWGSMSPIFVTFLIAASCLLTAATAVGICPRILYQLARHAKIPSIFGLKSRHEVHGPALLLCLLNSLMYLTMDFETALVIGETGYYISIMGVHLGIWMRRGHSESRWPRLALIFFCLEALVLAHVAFNSRPLGILLGIFAPLVALGYCIYSVRLSFGPFRADWWAEKARMNSVSSSLSWQVAIWIFLLCTVSGVTWSVARLLQSTSQGDHDHNILAFGIVVMSFFGVAVAAWTSIRQFAELALARQELSQARDELTRRYDQASGAIENMEQQKQTLIEAIGDGIFGLDKNGITTFINPSGASLLGYTPAQLIGQVQHQMVHHSYEDGSHYPKDCCPIYASITDGKARTSDREFFWRKDGTKFPIEYTTAPLFDKGEVQGSVIIFRDITERLHANEKIRINEERYRLLMENVQGYAIIMLDSNGNVTNWNLGAERINGYSSKEIIGQHFSVFYPPEQQSNGLPEITLQKTLELGRYDTEGWLIKKDGSKFWASSLLTALYDMNGKIRGLAQLTRDMTERKQAEEDLRNAHQDLEQRVIARTHELTESNEQLKNQMEARKQMELELAQARDAALESVRLKSEFLANMSHEIRTPMNGVIGMTGLLLDTPLTEKQFEFAETIRNCADSLLTVINDILDFSKIDAGKLELEMLEFDIYQVVESVVELLAHQANRKRIELISIIACDVPRRLKGDPGRLRQVLINLLNNGLKFTEKGSVTIRVCKDVATFERMTLRFEVVDTGIGIKEATQNRLFYAFSQADGSNTRKYGGTGLGLAISKQLTTLMGGNIGVRSKLGEGSTFWCCIPFDIIESEADVQGLNLSTLSNKCVLIVDDNSMNSEMLQAQTASWGMINKTVASGVEALENMRSEAIGGRHYEFALINMQMSGMDGLQLAKRIRADPLIRKVKLILLTSLEMIIPSDELDSAHIAVCLIKPIKQSQLFDALTSQGLKLPLKSTDESKNDREGLKTDNIVSKAVTDIRILVAEDNHINQRIALLILQRLGYAAEAVADGHEVLAALERISYDIILMDCQMPEMDGYMAAAEIRQLSNEKRNTVIIAMTANALQGDREKCLNAGMNDYISKPVNSKDLQSVLEKWVKKVLEVKGISVPEVTRKTGS
ncbi:MAG TPA: PAS domain S-box protein [Oligoflexus sp.]|uniref:PAS domain S-box protein n=1 Tax=Oligoflexus sp. TaxID=1971216 RepID=UPI002D2C4606|nr:PAS domain S-box protein [Oligoflexus sp.]HYX38406.1 PAS domain S-box protein [Oligoflexus sp.]